MKLKIIVKYYSKVLIYADFETPGLMPWIKGDLSRRTESALSHVNNRNYQAFCTDPHFRNFCAVRYENPCLQLFCRHNRGKVCH